MSTNGKSLRILVVDDNRDGADSLGLLLEAMGNYVHVTYGGAKALAVAATFQPNLVFIDLVMPDMDGCGLAVRLRQNPAFTQTTMIAITGHKDEQHRSAAMRAGFDTILFKPIALAELKAALATVAVPSSSKTAASAAPRASADAARRLPMDEARRIRRERMSKSLTQAECEAAICDGIVRFQEEYLGFRTKQINVHVVRDLVVVRILAVLTVAEQQLGKSLPPDSGRDLIKKVRKQLLEVARPMLESLVHEAVGVKALSMHHDVSTVTGEEIIIFSLAGTPRFE